MLNENSIAPLYQSLYFKFSHQPRDHLSHELHSLASLKWKQIRHAITFFHTLPVYITTVYIRFSSSHMRDGTMYGSLAAYDEMEMYVHSHLVRKDWAPVFFLRSHFLRSHFSFRIFFSSYNHYSSSRIKLVSRKLRFMQSAGLVGIEWSGIGWFKLCDWSFNSWHSTLS